MSCATFFTGSQYYIELSLEGFAYNYASSFTLIPNYIQS